jgi:hypothetical protein
MASLTSLTNLQCLHLCGCGISINESSNNSSVEENSAALQASAGSDAGEGELEDSSSDGGSDGDQNSDGGDNDHGIDAIADEGVNGDGDMILEDEDESDAASEEDDSESSDDYDPSLVDVHLLAHRPCSSIRDHSAFEV